MTKRALNATMRLILPLLITYKFYKRQQGNYNNIRVIAPNISIVFQKSQNYGRSCGLSMFMPIMKYRLRLF